jgi:osmoprotectant transport system permease protein
MTETIRAFFDKLGGDILQATYEHMFLTFFALVVAVSIALPLGIYLTRCRWQRLVNTIMGFISVIQTIPSLALVAIIGGIFVILNRIGLDVPTIGIVPGIITLVAYALLPILRNTYTGIRQVDPSVIEVATGMGMKPSQVLFSIELPLALPGIMAGLRIATVWTIGVACLASLISAGGLGDLIMRGLRSMHFDYLVAGTVPAALLALFFDWILGRIEKWLTPEGIREEETAAA